MLFKLAVSCVLAVLLSVLYKYYSAISLHLVAVVGLFRQSDCYVGLDPADGVLAEHGVS